MISAAGGGDGYSKATSTDETDCDIFWKLDVVLQSFIL